MLRINLTNEPRWLDFGGGLRLEVLPADMDLISEAQEDPALQELRAQLDPDEEPTREQAIALGKALARAVAQLAIIGWEGVGDAEGRVIAKPTPEGIDALMRHPAVFPKFQSEYIEPALVLADEGNGYAPAPSGTLAGARTTAKPARRAAKPARKKTTPRRR